MPSLLLPFLSGVTFGTALLFTGLIRQLFLLTTTSDTPNPVFIPHDHSFHLPVFYILILYLVSSASSVLVVYLANNHKITWFRRVSVKSRASAEYGWFRYDGNVIGGLLQGAGMMATVSEPGSVFVRLGLGGRVGRGSQCLVLGGLVGGLVFVLVNGRLKRKGGARSGDGEGKGKGKGTATTSALGTSTPAAITVPAATPTPTLNELFDLSVNEGVAVYTLTVVCVVSLMAQYLHDSGMPIESWIEPIVGGLLLGVAQLVSIALTGGTVGVSSVYPNIATHLLRQWGWPLANPGYGSIVFTMGMVLVGVYVATLGPDMGRRGEVIHRDSRVDFFGGVAIILGARIAGGCTSGHGISGAGTLSLSSFVTVMSMVAGAGLWKMFCP